MKSVKLAFENYGNSSNTALIILHGFFASSRNWRQIAKKLAKHYLVYVVDIRNHGLSPHDPEMDYPIMAEDLKVFMDEHQLQTANILGHSMGGKITMWFALTHPERVDRLVIADISPVSYQHSFNHIIQALKQLPLSEISNRKQADDFLSGSIPDLPYRQFLLQNLQLNKGEYSWRVDLDIFYRTADNIITFPSTEFIEPYLGKTLFIMGEKSNFTDKKAIDTSFPHAEISTIKDASHWLHIDKPKAFLDLVISFL